MIDRLRVVVLGYVVRAPLGGLAWHYLHYVLGLASLGHQVLYLETNDGDPLGCYDPSVDRSGDDPTYGLRFTSEAFASMGLPDAWAYLHRPDGPWAGPASEMADRFCGEADLVINVSGVNALLPRIARAPHRVLIDTDPVFQQVRVLTEPGHAEFVRRHTSLFTFATRIDTPDHGVPDDGLIWKPTVQPVELTWWPPSPVPAGGRFTTVMQWDSYKRRTWQGSTYGMKAESFRPYFDLPARVPVPMEIALGSPGAPRDELRRAGWVVRNPLEVTRSPQTYRDYLASSLGEFSVAKHGYVAARSGWFSERTANYLASGRPVVVQDTGFSEIIECGTGLLAFSTPEEAADAIDQVIADPRLHGEKARELAEAHFDARKVLPHLLERAL